MGIRKSDSGMAEGGVVDGKVQYSAGTVGEVGGH